MLFSRSRRASTALTECTRVNLRKSDTCDTRTHVYHSGSSNPRTANPTFEWTEEDSINGSLSSAQKSYTKGAHGASCQRGCMPKMLVPGEILHYIPSATSKIPGYEALDSHYVLILNDSYKKPTYRDSKDWRACLVISSHPLQELQRRPLRQRTEPYHTLGSLTHLSTAIFDRFHAPKCNDIPYCTHVQDTTKYDRKLWRSWEWSPDTQISIEAPKMVQTRCLHVLRPLSPSLGVRLCTDALETVWGLIPAQPSSNSMSAFTANTTGREAITSNAITSNDVTSDVWLSESMPWSKRFANAT